ncbi:MAG: aminomethyltransferase family protein [Halobacteriales archaeon]
MTDLRTLHEQHGATFSERAGVETVSRYHDPERTHRAVRNVAGVTEMPYGVLRVEGADRIEYVDDVVTNRVPREEGEGTYAFLLNPQGRIETDIHVHNAGDHLLLFTPPDKATWVDSEWEVFIEDVDIEVATDAFAVFGVHGSQATEKIASVLTGSAAPEQPRSFVRGSLGDVGVTVVRTDAPTGETGYEVICASDDAADVFDGLINHGLNAVPFGAETWDALTLEAGTPLFRPDLEGRIPNATGVRSALDFEKGCFVGQEVVSRIENRGRPPKELVGLRPAERPEPGAAVFAGDEAVGDISRAAESPMLEALIALAYVDFGVEGDVTVRVEGEEVDAERIELPFLDGSDTSGRLPRYDPVTSL